MYNAVTRDELLSRFNEEYPMLASMLPDILKAVDIIVDCYKSGGRVFCCGNGGSSADSAHIVGELLKGFLRKRPQSAEMKDKLKDHGELGEMMAEKLQGSLAAFDLTAQQSIISAVANDTDPALVYAQQLYGLGRPGDVLIGISTSGNAKNVLCAGIVAQELGMTSIAFSGVPGGIMAKKFDLALLAPSDRTPRIQEFHIAIYHLLCALVEDAFFPV